MKRSTRPVHRLTPQLALMGGIMAISPMSVDMYLPAFPAIANDLHATAAEVSNTLAVFLLAMGVGQLFTGPLADRYGRRRPLLGGLIGFALTAALCAVATNIGLFTFARALAALSVCMTSVCIRAMVRDRYDPVEGARVMSKAQTGLGIIAGWGAIFLGLSFYVRRWFGARRWRTIHRATILVWALAVIHTLGAGTDATQFWMRAILLTTGVPIVFLFLRRVMPGEAKPARRTRPAQPAQPAPESAGAPR